MTTEESRREADLAIRELSVKVEALQEGQDKVWDKLDAMHILLHDQCNDCPPSIIATDHEARLRVEEKKSNELDGKITGMKVLSGIISSIVGVAIAILGFALKLHK